MTHGRCGLDLGHRSVLWTWFDLGLVEQSASLGQVTWGIQRACRHALGIAPLGWLGRAGQLLICSAVVRGMCVSFASAFARAFDALLLEREAAYRSRGLGRERVRALRWEAVQGAGRGCRRHAMEEEKKRGLAAPVSYVHFWWLG